MEFVLDTLRLMFEGVIAIFFVMSATGLLLLGMREFSESVLRLMDAIEYLRKPKPESRKDEP